MSQVSPPVLSPPPSGASFRVVGGVALLVAGCAMLLLPGPGVVTMLAAAALLERDVPVVGRWMRWVRSFHGGASSEAPPEAPSLA